MITQNHSKKNRIEMIAKWWNYFINITWMPLLVIGYLILKKQDYIWSFYCHPIGILDYIIYAFGGYLFYKVSFIAAYIHQGGQYSFMCEYEEVTDHLKKLQIYSMSVISHLWICGLLMILAAFMRLESRSLLFGVHINFFLALTHLLPVDTTIGIEIISQALACGDIVEKSVNLIFNQSYTNELLEDGITGKATYVFCWIIAIFQLLYPLIVIVGIVNFLTALKL